MDDMVRGIEPELVRKELPCVGQVDVMLFFFAGLRWSCDRPTYNRCRRCGLPVCLRCLSVWPKEQRLEGTPERIHQHDYLS